MSLQTSWHLAIRVISSLGACLRRQSPGHLIPQAWEDPSTTTNFPTLQGPARQIASPSQQNIENATGTAFNQYSTILSRRFCYIIAFVQNTTGNLRYARYPASACSSTAFTPNLTASRDGTQKGDDRERTCQHSPAHLQKLRQGPIDRQFCASSSGEEAEAWRRLLQRWRLEVPEQRDYPQHIGMDLERVWNML